MTLFEKLRLSAVPWSILIAYNFFPELIKAFYPKRLPEQVFQPFTRIYALDLFRQFTAYTAKTLRDLWDVRAEGAQLSFDIVDMWIHINL